MKRNAVVVASQVRRCEKGHEWKITRYSSQTGDRASTSWTEGGLMCPKCGGRAKSGRNVPVEK